MLIAGTMTLDKLAGRDVTEGVILLTEPTPVPGTSTLRALANVRGALCVVELSVRFAGGEVTFIPEEKEATP